MQNANFDSRQSSLASFVAKADHFKNLGLSYFVKNFEAKRCVIEMNSPTQVNPKETTSIILKSVYFLYHEITHCIIFIFI